VTPMEMALVAASVATGGSILDPKFVQCVKDPEDRVALNQYILAMKRLNRIEEANAAALRLRDVLDQERLAEVRKNRVRLILPLDSHP